MGTKSKEKLQGSKKENYIRKRNLLKKIDNKSHPRDHYLKE